MSNIILEGEPVCIR